MKKFAIALTMVFGLNMIGSIIERLSPITFAQEEPAPQPTPKPEKPDSE
ncbi:MAG: hypothetical protein ACREQV_15730 [Candidatus Binatia bacterium]